MSYAALILKDSPEIIWALEETEGLFVEPDRFTNGTDYRGDYYENKFKRSSVPIVYAGKRSVYSTGSFSSNYSTNNKMFSVPSAGKFSSATRTQSYTFEFWMNLVIDPTKLDSGALSRLGESKIVGLSGASDSGLYIRDLDYLVFKVGDTSFRKFESAVHVPSFNTPLHVVAIYTPYSIQLIVNGVEGKISRITEEVFGDEEERTIDFLFPDRISSQSEYFDAISYDTIALYPQALTSSAAKRHYVYGLGFDVPKFLIKNVGGVHYETNMQLSTPLKTINYLNNDSWSSRIQLNNLVATDNNLSTATFNNHSLVISSADSNLTESDMITVEDSKDSIVFPAETYSYLEINNYESISNGQTKKIEAIFNLLSGHSTTGEQQLMYIGSKSVSSKYISCTIENRTVKIKYKEIDGTESTIAELILTSGATEFLLSIVKDGADLNVSIVDELNGNDTATVTNSVIFPMQDSFIRFGSAPIFFGNSIPRNIALSEISRFDGSLNQVDILDETLLTTAWSSRKTQKVSDLYQLYPNANTKNICVATSGSFSMVISLLDLIGLDEYDKPTANINGLAARVEIGSNSAEVKYDYNYVVNGTLTTLETMDIRQLRMVYDDKLSQNIQYDITGTIRSSDIFTTPGVLDCFRIYTYKVNSGSYIEINDSVPGNNLKYYSTAGTPPNSFYQLPEIEKTTDLHRSFNTGIFIGKTPTNIYPFLEVDFDVRTVTDTINTKINTIMFVGRLANGLQDDLIFLTSTETGEIGFSDPEPVGSGIELYINGERYDSETTYDLSLWTHFCIKITGGIDYNSNVKFGCVSGAGMLIDNISIMTESLSAEKILYFYGTYFGDTSIRVPVGQDTDYLNILISDKEMSDGAYDYQPLIGQAGFTSRSVCPDLATSSEVNNFAQVGTSSTWILTFGSNKDLLKIDGIELQVGNLIMFKNQSTTSQNGIYEVTGKTTTTVVFDKKTTPSLNYLVFVKNGNENKNYYFIRTSTGFEKAVIQKKAVAYNDVSAAITATVRYSA